MSSDTVITLEPAVDIQHSVVKSAHQASIQPTSSQRLAYIDALRGIAALGVLLCHVHAYWLDSVHTQTMGLLARIITAIAIFGVHGVDLFIVLSGFCLFYPLLQKGVSTPRRLDTANFYRRRVHRLLPAYYAALTIAFLFAISPRLQPLVVARQATLTDLLAHIFLIQTFFKSTSASINGSFWSIALEAQLYIVFPVLLLIYKRYGLKLIVALGIASTILWGMFWIGYSKTSIGANFGGNSDFHFPDRWIEFICGMVAASRIRNPKPLQHLWALGMFAVLLPLTVLSGPLHVWLPFVHIACGGLFGALLVCMSVLPKRFFEGWGIGGALTQVGIVSYSLYLLHQPALLLTSPIVHAVHLNILTSFGFFAFVELPLLLLVAFLFFRYIEQPFLVRAKR